MATANAQSSRFKWSDLLKQTDLIFTLGLFGIILLLVIPIPTWALDFFLSVNIGMSLMILLVIIYVKDPPEFSAFPTILLAVTLLRLALNIASTRLILLDGFAGNVIEAFGHVLIQGNYIVGAVVFIILVIINFVVITKGAGRIAEVAARFTLDAMPGKQMAIDAELNAGIIDELTATSRRLKVQKEADFYGAMDGASKFVRGDAVAGILITFINVIGGFGIGMLQKGLPIEQALQKYTLLSIGDGLVSQVPALGDFGRRRSSCDPRPGGQQPRRADRQTTRSLPARCRHRLGPHWRAGLRSGHAWPLLPHPRWHHRLHGLYAEKAIPSSCRCFRKIWSPRASGPWRIGRRRPARLLIGTGGQSSSGPEDLHKLIEADVLSIEVGYGLLRLADKTQGGDLLDRITGVRKASPATMAWSFRQ
jgi:flagellar biosynthesis protein FlhA